VETNIDRLIVLGFLLLVASVVSLAQHLSETSRGGDKDEVLKTDAAYRTAIQKSDVETLQRILKDDILIVHSDGDIDSKKNFLDALSSGRLKMRSYARTNIELRIHGSTALLLSQTRKIFDYKGSPGTDNDTSIVTYVKEDGRWRIVAMQNTHRAY
jgi:ketosteroid isomerase-like protein